VNYIIENEMLSREFVTKKLDEIILRIKNINIEDKEESLFCIKYYISPEEMAYILLLVREEFNIDINTDFVDDLEEISFNKIINSIMRYKQLNLAI
jgi:hypothetical protein